MQQYQFEIKEPERTTLNKLIDLLCHHKSSFPFHKPVDYVQLGLPDYPIVIQTPMDLQTVREKLREYQYASVADCLMDLLLIWENCRKYNQPTNQMLVKMANEMEAYQLRITKNYLPPRKALYKRTKKYTATPVKVEERSQEEANIEPCKKQERVEKIEQRQPVMEVKEKIQEKVEANIETNIDCSAHLENLAVQAQRSLQKINEVMRSVVPKVQSSIQSESEWDMIGHQIRQHFLDLMKECNDCEVTLIFMMMKRRCPRCLDFDRQGNSTINLSRIDDYTIALATSQIKVWKNKQASGLVE